jgi:hypothetical protein
MAEREEILTTMENATASCENVYCSFGIDGLETFAISNTYGYNYVPFFETIGAYYHRATALGPGIRYYYTERTTNLTDEIPERIGSAKDMEVYKLFCLPHPYLTMIVVSTSTLYGHSNYVSTNWDPSYVIELAENGTLTERYWYTPRECAPISSAYSLIMGLAEWAVIVAGVLSVLVNRCE